MLLYILWEIVLQGPSPGNILRFSNRKYIDIAATTGLYGKSYRASWTPQSFRSLEINMMKYRVEGGKDPDGSHITSTGGMNPRRIKSIEVVNVRPGKGQDRELDYLFDSSNGYTLRGTIVGKMAFGPVTGVQPDIGDFVNFFTGVININPVRSSDRNTITWFMESILKGETKGPLLTERFNGMGGFVEITSDKLSIPPPSFITGDFTLQIYSAFDVGTVGPEGLVRVRDFAQDVLFEIYYDLVDDSLKIGVDDKTDIYTLLSIGAPIPGFFQFRFITIAWDETNGIFNAWINGVRVFTDEVIVNSIIGTEDEILLGDSLFDATFQSSFRIWTDVKTESEVFEREGAIDYADEVNLLRAWDFDEARGDVVIDQSVNRAHIDTSAVTLVRGSTNDGNAFLTKVIKPIALGTVWNVPVLLIDPKLSIGLISDVLFDTLQVYSQGIALVKDEVANTSGTFTFDNVGRTLSKQAPDFFGFRLVVNQKLVISSSASGDFDGVFTIEALIPPPARFLPPQGLDFRTDVQVIESWPSSSTEFAIVKNDPNHANWDVLSASSKYYDEPNIESQLVSFKNAVVTPLSANVIGDRHILATGAPAGFNPPDDLANILTQIFTVYGPKWDSGIFPLPVYNLIDYRVGYYISDAKSTKDVVNDISTSCLTWIVEDGDGVVSLQEFLFPEDLSDPQTILESEVIKVVQPHFKEHGLSTLTTLEVNYARSWTTMEEGSIPAGVDPDTKSFITKEWRKVLVGTSDGSDTITPTFTTYVNDKSSATKIGEIVLRLSQGVVHFITFRLDAISQLTAFQQGVLVNADLPKYNLSNMIGVSFGPILHPTIGQITVAVWSEQ